MLPDVDLRLAVLLVWGGGTVFVYGRVLRGRYRSFSLHRDERSRRELMASFALFLTALCSCLAVGFVLFGQAGTGIRAFSTAVALGAFFAAGIVMSSESKAEGE